MRRAPQHGACMQPVLPAAALPAQPGLFLVVRPRKAQQKHPPPLPPPPAGARHITISTVGVPNAIPRLAARQLQSTLAVSIHSPTQALRESLVPSARAYPLEALMTDCSEYFRCGLGWPQRGLQLRR